MIEEISNKSMEVSNWAQITKKDCERIFDDFFLQSKKDCKDELKFVFALLGINSGEEDSGWQPINETIKILKDFSELINSNKENEDLQIRLGLMLYSQITESNYMYHILYNMLLARKDIEPTIYNFIDKTRNGNPPSVKSKVSKIQELLQKSHFVDMSAIFDNFFRYDIRNAVQHADFILYDAKFRMKHKQPKFNQIDFDQVFVLIQNAITVFETFFIILDKYKRQYRESYEIKNRVNKNGQRLMSVTLIIENGVVSGFRGDEPLPLW